MHDSTNVQHKIYSSTYVQRMHDLTSDDDPVPIHLFIGTSRPGLIRLYQTNSFHAWQNSVKKNLSRDRDFNQQSKKNIERKYILTRPTTCNWAGQRVVVSYRVWTIHSSIIVYSFCYHLQLYFLFHALLFSALSLVISSCVPYELLVDDSCSPAPLIPVAVYISGRLLSRNAYLTKVQLPGYTNWGYIRTKPMVSEMLRWKTLSRAYWRKMLVQCHINDGYQQ